LARHPLLKDIATDTIAKLTKSVKKLDYTPPDCVLDSRNDDGLVYYVVEGAFAGYRVLADGSEAQVITYSKGDIFGLEALSSDRTDGFKVQASTYGILYQIDSSLMAELLDSPKATRNQLTKHLNDENKIINHNLELHAQKTRNAAKLAHHAALNLHLREHVEEIFAKPVLHRLIHLISPRSKERDLLEAMMAASALIANSRGSIDAIEIEYLRKNLGAVELFRHIESAEAISHFEQFAEQLKNGNKDALLNRLRAISGEPKLNRLVIGLAHGMTSLHGDALPEEEVALKEVAMAMNTTASLEELVAEIKTSS
jgi:CRP-like cAMP-binding protein